MNVWLAIYVIGIIAAFAWVNVQLCAECVGAADVWEFQTNAVVWGLVWPITAASYVARQKVPFILKFM